MREVSNPLGNKEHDDDHCLAEERVTRWEMRLILREKLSWLASAFHPKQT